MNELAGQILGGYYLEEEIGRGSMGVVYRGRQIALGREVAIKLLPQALARDFSYVARFIREAQIIAGLNHPGIVQIYDAGQHEKQLYFVMEYVQGPTLASLLQMDGTISLHLAVEYAAQIADALDAAYHERNVIHRDIKPENLMLSRWGNIKIMDFGLARATGLQKITVAKTLVGSIYYSSPEQIWGQPLDNRSDIYALGVVLYEMVTGQRPFNGRSLPDLTQNIINNSPKSPRVRNPEIPAQLETIILTALARDRAQRYEHAGTMAQHLRTLQFGPRTAPLHLKTSTASTQPQPPLKERFVVQPPKRPQAQRPQYLEQEQSLETAPAPDREAGQTLLKPQRKKVPPQINTESPTLPLQATAPYTTQFRPPLATANEPDTNGEMAATPQPWSRSTERRTLWHHLRSKLKSPRHS